MAKTSSIWGSLSLQVGEKAEARLGRLLIEVYRSALDWWIVTKNESESALMGGIAQESAAERSYEPWAKESWSRDGSLPESAEASPGQEIQRLLVNAPEVRVLPALADRPVIIRPTAAMTVPPLSKVQLYVGSPLWFELLLDELVLYSRPVQRPSDTWLGSPVQGELCYSGRTQGRLRLENLQPLPARAVTRVEVENATPEAFDFDRLTLPAPVLSLYRGSDWIWTNDVKLVHGDTSEYASLETHGGPPMEATTAELLRGPRRLETEQSQFLAFGTRALGALFG